ncbi:glycosyltransferase [Limosilactobacillus mucosae]
MEKRVSISIVAYKNYNKILNVIKSINKFTIGLTKEIIIVDNTDAPYKNLKMISVIERQKDVRVISVNKNIGFGKANNLAFEKSKGLYFAIINPDILFLEDSLTKIIDYMENNSDIGAVIPKLVDKKHRLLPVYRRKITLWDILVRYINPFGIFNKRIYFHTMKDKDYDSPFVVPFGQGSFLVVKTSIYKKVHGFDERYFMYLEDADLCRKINSVSKLVFFPYTTVIHLWQASSHKNLKLMFRHFASMIKYFKKWGIS